MKRVFIIISMILALVFAGGAFVLLLPNYRDGVYYKDLERRNQQQDLEYKQIYSFLDKDIICSLGGAMNRHQETDSEFPGFMCSGRTKVSEQEMIEYFKKISKNDKIYEEEGRFGRKVIRFSNNKTLTYIKVDGGIDFWINHF